MTNKEADDTMKERILAGAPAGEVVPEEILSGASDAVKDRWLSILIQLTNSQRFTKFVEANYTIGDRIDEDSRTIETLVIEKPVAVGPPLSPAQLVALRGALEQFGAKDPNEALAVVCKILAQEESPITLSTDVEGQLKRKLDA